MLIALCWAEFPLVIPVDPSIVPSEILAEHKILRESIEQAPKADFERAKTRLQMLKKRIPKNLEEQIKENNYFVASLMFYIDGTREPRILKIRRNFFSSSEFYISNFCLDLNEYFVTVNKYLSGEIYKSASDIIVYKNLRLLQAKFLEIAQTGNNPSALIIGSLLQTVNVRTRFDEPTPSYMILNTDSEAYMLAYLQQASVQANIVRDIEKLIPKGRKVVHIVLNGCTTRDMCGLCCTNMNILQYMANHKNNYTFLNVIKNALVSTELSNEDCPITSYISSTQPYGGNLWFAPQFIKPCQFLHVNIFRF